MRPRYSAPNAPAAGGARSVAAASGSARHFRTVGTTSTTRITSRGGAQEPEPLGLDAIGDSGLVPNGKRITVRELLNHTSGLFDYTGDARFAETSLRNRTDAWSPREVVRVATSHGPVFVPGSEWSYSNTDYVVLGLIVEAASGHQIGTELRNRIFEPLNLHGTSFDSSPRISGQYAHGYSTLTGPRQDVSVFDPSGAWAAGAIVSTADDLASFYRALLRGRLLPPDLLKTMETTVPVPADPSGGGSGLGLFATGTPCGRIWGHDGIYFGYKTTAY
jgi:D-alanyl-D-alanine carboxypeptidase